MAASDPVKVPPDGAAEPQSAAVPRTHGSEHDVVVVLLGASNLARGHQAVVNHLRKGLEPHHVEFISALGPGRAYCVEGGVLQVRYRSIESCGVLEAIRQRAQSPCQVIALVTDIGNDIMYGVSEEDIIQCLGRTFDSLRALNAHVIATAIHVDLEREVGEYRFLLLRTLFFPRSSVTYRQAAAAIRTINSFLAEKEDDTFHVVKDMKRYVGADKIHYTLLKSHLAWTRLTAEMFRCFKLSQPRKIGWIAIVSSLLFNVFRVLFSDLVPLWRRSTGLF